MRARTQCLGKWELGVLILCVVFTLLTIGAVGEQGRWRAKEIVCQANLSQWRDILHGYIDPNGRFISGDKGTPGYWWIKQLSEEHKDWKRTRIWFCPTSSGPSFSEQSGAPVNMTPFSAWGIFTGSGLGPNGISGSYGLNGYLIPLPLPTRQGTIPPRVPPAPITYQNGVPAEDGWRNLVSIPQGNTVPMFLEALRFDLWPLWTDPPAENEFAAWTGNHMARCCINRHDGAVNCLFVDGSVRKVGLKELWTLRWYQSFNTAGWWTMAGGVMPNDWPEWMRPFKDY
jgi:prepilin-type processing-associated H-X9-DG protein